MNTLRHHDLKFNWASRSKIVFVLALIFFPMGCAIHRQDAITAKSVVIFIPGFYGSTLKEKESGRRIFISLRELLFGSTTLSLYNEELATPAAPQLEVDGILEGVSLIPGLYDLNFYGGFLRELRTIARNHDKQVITFPYDWRADLPETVGKLAATIESLKAQGVTRIELVAHSMGCLISTYYLAYGTQAPDHAVLNWAGAREVKKAVLMAGPYGGSFTIFRNMQNGAELSGNRTLLPGEALASFPSSYQLIPFDAFHLFDKMGHPIDFQVQDAREWQKLKLGLLKRQDLSSSIKIRRSQFVTQQLQRARTFSELLQLRGPQTPPPDDLQILQLIGKGRPTLDAAYFMKEKSRFYFDNEKINAEGLNEKHLFQDGDGSVTRASARMPRLLEPRATLVFTEMEHSQIFEDSLFQKRLLDFLK